MPEPRSGWRAEVERYVELEACPVEKFGHQPRLYALTLQVGAGLEYDDDAVFAAAWLHDMGVFVGHRPEERELLERWDNVAYALRIAPDLLIGFGFPEEKIPAVIEIIRVHQPSGHPKTIEGIIIRDADILEQLGAAGILRTVSKVGRDTRFQTFPDALSVLQKNADGLFGQLRLETSRQLAEPRLQVLKAFLRAAAAEGCQVQT